MIKIEVLKKKYPEVPPGLWSMFESLDAYTYNHSIRVCEMCTFIEDEECFEDHTLSLAALFHDIGKYYITSKVLNKHGNLQPHERQIIDTHAFLSYQTLKHFGLSKKVCEIALFHHDLKPVVFGKTVKKCTDDEVAGLAMIVKTADIFEACTTDRPYHRGLTNETATAQFTGIDYDKKALTILVESKKFDRE